MCLPHCLAFFSNNLDLSQPRQFLKKMQRIAENSCVNGMCKRAFRLVKIVKPGAKVAGPKKIEITLESD